MNESRYNSDIRMKICSPTNNAGDMTQGICMGQIMATVVTYFSVYLHHPDIAGNELFTVCGLLMCSLIQFMIGTVLFTYDEGVLFASSGTILVTAGRIVFGVCTGLLTLL
jgi:hypothetical protein